MLAKGEFRLKSSDANSLCMTHFKRRGNYLIIYMQEKGQSALHSASARAEVYETCKAE